MLGQKIYSLLERFFEVWLDDAGDWFDDIMDSPNQSFFMFFSSCAWFWGAVMGLLAGIILF